MPPGTPYNSFVVPYPIRVDEFSELRDGPLPTTALHLLTHTHSDHIIGLHAKSFGSVIICSADAKEMLLRHETYQARYLRNEEYLVERVRTYKHLKASIQSLDDRDSYDLLRVLPLDVPTEIEISNNEWVTITLINANHCPGSVMFLIEGSKGAILHTGDFRAEPAFIDFIMKNPFLRRYLAPDGNIMDAKTGGYGVPKTLEAIYLDTACMLRTFTVPTKEDATNGLIELMMAFPAHMRFFINTWTWGYEDILKAIFRSFESKVHVDRYKYEVYTNLSDPVLRALVTRDFKSTRFHACERFSRCDLVRNDDPGVVYINPVNISCEKWELYLARTKAQLDRGDLPMHILVPLHRHSPLPELQTFVALFKPNRLVPNFLEPSLQGLDWACMPAMFGLTMAEGGAARIRKEMSDTLTSDGILQLDTDKLVEDSELENLEGGCGVRELEALVRVWTAAPCAEGGRSSAGNAVQQMQRFLSKGVSALVERALQNARQKKLPKVYVKSDTDNDSLSDDEGHERTAKFIFGGEVDLTRPNVSPTSSPISSPMGAMNGIDSSDPATSSLTPGIGLNVNDQAAQTPVTPPSSNLLHLRQGLIKNQQDDSSASFVPTACDSELSTNYTHSCPLAPASLNLKAEETKSIRRELGSCGRLCSKKVPFVNVDNILEERKLSRHSTSPSSTSTGNIASLIQWAFSSRGDGHDIAEIISAPTQPLQLDLRAQTSNSSSIATHPDSISIHSSFTQSARSMLNRSVLKQQSMRNVKEKKVKRKERRNLLSKLSFARPDLATQKHEVNLIRERRRASIFLAIAERADSGANITGIAADSNAQLNASVALSNEAGMDWDRSRALEKQILEDLRSGRKPVLPSMKFIRDGLFVTA